MPFPKGHNAGKEKHESERGAFNAALKRWKDEPPESRKRSRLAQDVCSHAGAMNVKLRDLVDEKTAEAILEDMRKCL